MHELCINVFLLLYSLIQDFVQQSANKIRHTEGSSDAQTKRFIAC